MRPRRQGATLARLEVHHVVADPVDGAPAVMLAHALHPLTAASRVELLLRRLAAADAGRPEEDDRVADALLAEAAMRLHVLRHDAKRPCVSALQKLLAHVSQRLRVHRGPLYHLL